MIIVVHHDHGLAWPWPKAYQRMVDRRLRLMTEAEAYATGRRPANYPMPAKRMRTFEYWRYLGEVSALNEFDIEAVQSLNRYR